ncbi:conserved glutamic acid-rich protein [Venturia nashicola]|uniref:Conserved glutamic acid-rich protein n=1 Tax=Venturia nashicola TaxID=86259 RepID=A0A4Z1P967_9PEZI|nr:conserved glutamic acid-rich protein [Venturia nashicola]
MALMVPLQASFLEVPAPDDDMEITSDAGRAEPDNDIDLLDGDDDIDYMLEDTRSEQGQSRLDEMPDAGRDDIMYDDDLDEITYTEEEMHEDVPVPDEHLTDVGEYLEHSGVAQPAQPVIVDAPTTPPQVHNTSFDTYIINDEEVLDNDVLVHTVGYVEVDQEQHDYDAPPPTISTEPTEAVTAVPELEGEEETQEQEQKALQESPVDVVASPRKNSAGEASSSTIPTDSLNAPVQESTDTPQLIEPTNPTSQIDAPEPPLNDGKQSAIALQTPVASPKESTNSSQEVITDSVKPDEVQNEAAGSSQQPGDDKQEDAGPRDSGPPRSFHTTVVDYEGAHISLFPPMEEDEADTFLLGDISLADKTLVDLFRACRQVLGDSIDDSLELEIYCEDLDLTIPEDSTDCMTTSFSQLVDVYVTLSRQDGIDHPEPFSIIMAKKPRWSSRLSTLYLAAAESKGLSAVQTDQSLEEYAEVDDEYEENCLEAENGPSTDFTVGTVDEDDDKFVPAQSSTESRFEDGTEETTGESAEAQETATTTITDTEPAHNETCSSEGGPADEVSKEDNNNNVHETEAEAIDTTEHRDTNQLELVGQDCSKTVSAPELAASASAGDDSLDQIGGIETGDNISSGSSTVQGETNQPSSQYSLWDDSDDDDRWLTIDEDAVHEGSPDQLPTASGLDDTHFPDSFSDANAEDQATALADDGEWPEGDDEAQPEPYPEDAYTQDSYYEDPEAAPQEWDQIGHEETQTYDDANHDEVPHADETSEQVADREWATFDEDLDFDVGVEQQHADEATVSVPGHSTSSGTFRVPDDSAGEEDEDSITYDDEELDVHPHSKSENVQTQSSSQSPLGKRSRDDDDSDQDSKRLKSQ